MNAHSYEEGSWFALPLASGVYSLGVVVARFENVAVGYFFNSAFEQQPTLSAVSSCRPEDAFRIIKFVDRELVQGHWAILGQCPSWDRNAWPIPDPSSGKVWEVFPSGDHPYPILDIALPGTKKKELSQATTVESSVPPEAVVIALTQLITPSPSSLNQGSSEWVVFGREMGEHGALLRVDVGIAERLDHVPDRLLLAAVTIKSNDGDGLPSSPEEAALDQIEAAISLFAQSRGDTYAGFISIAGQRHFYVYNGDEGDAWTQRIEAIAESSGYEISAANRSDKDHSKYWDYLYPTGRDWQIINDFKSLQTMQAQGDDLEAEREVDHYAYFKTKATADEFRAWAIADGFSPREEIQSIDGSFGFRFFRVDQGTEIPQVTSLLEDQAKKLGGEYDGWEAALVKRQ